MHTGVLIPQTTLRPWVMRLLLKILKLNIEKKLNIA